MSHILVVDNDDMARGALRRLLERHGHGVSEAGDLQQASSCNLDGLDVIISDLRLPDEPGTELIKRTSTPVLIMTSYASLRSSIDAMNIGAVDYLSKPFDQDEILSAVRRVLEDDLKSQNQSRANPSPELEPVAGMVGSSALMLELYRRIRKAALTTSPVLVQGESGTGKELVARALHEASARKDSPLISVNCAAIPANLIESELFGHEKGAFENAPAIRSGLVEEANNGTLFLDEIGELSLDAQAQLLRVLQEHEIRRVDSVQPRKVDVRLVAATSHDLSQLSREGRFREDLFYRVNVIPLQIPPLRERGNDILELADKILHDTCARLDAPPMRFSADAIQAITTYPWPGNVRELRNAAERAVVLAKGSEIPMDLLGLDIELVKIDSLPPEAIENRYKRVDAGASGESGEAAPAAPDSRSDFRRYVLEHQERMNETELAKNLGISRKCLWERRQRLQIPRKRRPPA